ncbi:hypothetical protein KBC04_04730 [Candidatus Babeliales bacterium]|nr:hypothetical protein [Candidatus Babeliales bacterium]MBP9844125.1 hypothetical protein [Candidatus Babeliales bacterium]
MNVTKKMMVIAGIFLQLAGSAYGSDAWQAAFLAFGGGSDPVAAAQGVLNGPNSGSAVLALDLAKKNGAGTPEAFAIGRYMASNKKNLFKSNYQDSDVEAAGRAIIAEAASRAIAAAPMPTPSSETAQQPAAGWGWFGGNAAKSAAPAITAANVQAAMEAQKAADLADAVVNNDALAKIVGSGKSGVNLYYAFIDYIFSVLQQAVSSIADAGTQQQVLSYMQSKFATMKASVAANNYQARVLGRMDSKKVSKNNKNSKKNSSRK